MHGLLSVILFSAFCSQCGGWGGICWEQWQRQEVRRGKMDWCLSMDRVRGSSASPCPLSPCLAPLLLQHRAQPVPWAVEQGSCWGPRQDKPSLSSAEGCQRPLCSYCINRWVGMVNLLNNQLKKGDILAQTGWRRRWEALVFGDRQKIQLSKSLYFAYDSPQDFTFPFRMLSAHMSAHKRHGILVLCGI